MSFITEESTSFRLRAPAAYTLCVAGFLGVFGAGLNFAMMEGAGPVEPWRVGCLLAALGLWTWAGLDGATLARARNPDEPVFRIAQAFAFGYFLCIALLLMQVGSYPLHLSWFVYAGAGLFFGALIAAMPVSQRAFDSSPFFDQQHALDRGLLIKTLFVTWPGIALGLVTYMVSLPSNARLDDIYILALMVLMAAIWPLAYDLTKPYRSTFRSLMALGALFVCCAVFVP